MREQRKEEKERFLPNYAAGWFRQGSQSAVRYMYVKECKMHSCARSKLHWTALDCIMICAAADRNNSKVSLVEIILMR